MALSKAGQSIGAGRGMRRVAGRHECRNGGGTGTSSNLLSFRLDGKAAIGWQADTTSPHYFNNCRAEISFAETAMQRSGVPDYRLVKGWYKDTLRAFKPPASIAVLRLDCDWYEPTTQCLEALYQHLLPGGLLLLDDYYTWDGCVRAVQDFLARASLPERIRQSPHGIAYIVKGTSYFVKDQASYL